MPFFYAYLRVSHKDSAASGLSPEVQLDAIRKWFEYQKSIGNLPDHEWGKVGWEGGPDLDAKGLVRKDGQGNYMRIDRERTDGVFVDLAKSAFKRKFLERDAGIRLNAALRPGDMVGFYNTNRAFRRTGDTCNMWEQWSKRDIQIVFVTQQFDTRTAMGRAMMQMSAVYAEMDSAFKSEHQLELKAYARSKGRKVNRHDPLGWKKLTLDGKHWGPDQEQRAVMAAIIRVRHAPHPKTNPWPLVSDIIERELAEKTGRPYRHFPYYGKGKPRFWTPTRCMSGYRLALAEKWAELPEGVTPEPMKRRRRRSTPAG